MSGVSFQDHFSSRAALYAQARPTYPTELFAHLAALAPGRSLAWDCGAGNGQASIALTGHFTRVVATEPSSTQLAEAALHPQVIYLQSAESAPGLADGTVDLVTAAQAAHWFDRNKFYAEVQRVLRPNGVVALWSYELCRIEPAIDATVSRFYSETVGPFWPPERKHVENGYRDFEFPFAELPFPDVAMEQDWTLEQFASYLRTWSSVTRYTKAQGTDPVWSLAQELRPVWGSSPRRVVWPLAGRIGRKKD